MPPRKTPTAILLARGSKIGKARAAEPQPPTGIPTPLGKMNAAVKAMWDDHCERLAAAGILSDIDGGALERYCRAWVKYQELAAVDIEGMTIESIKDLETAQKRHERLLRQLSEHLLKIEREYGMTPSSRGHVTIGQKPPPVGPKPKSRWLR